MDKLGNKNFKGWFGLKPRLHYNARMPRIQDGEIWWCSFGENIGIEINGKSNRFSRPVVIMKKLNHCTQN